MEEAASTDGADLAVAKKSADRQLTELFSDHPAVVVGYTVELFAAPQAGE